MGTQRTYREEGGFSTFLYHQVGKTIIAPNGVEGKVMEKIDGTPYDGLPLFSDTSEVYLKANAKGDIVQARIYKNRRPVCDFDWEHEHTNKRSGEKFLAGTVHVQNFKQMPNGTWVRDCQHARYMSPSEMERYGPLLKMINPGVKLRP